MFSMFSKPPKAEEKKNNGSEFEQSPGFSIDRNPTSATFKIQSSMQRRIKTLVLFNLYPLLHSQRC